MGLVEQVPVEAMDPHRFKSALSAREFSDVIVFRSPPWAVQSAVFGALSPIARWRGYRATYPQLSRIVFSRSSPR